MRNLSIPEIEKIDKLLSIEEFEELVENENVVLYSFEGSHFYPSNTYPKKFKNCTKYAVLLKNENAKGVYVDIISY